MLEDAKEEMARRMLQAQTPSESRVVRILADTIARLEHQQSEAVLRLAEAADHSIDGGVVNVEERREQLLEVADAVSNDALAEWWFAQMDSDEMENAEKAAQYAGMGLGEDWAEQQFDWHMQHYRLDTVDNPPTDTSDERTREVAAEHVQSVYGVSLPVFESEVVEWSAGEAMQQVLAGPIQQHTKAIDQIARDLELVNEAGPDTEDVTGSTYPAESIPPDETDETDETGEE